MKHASVVTQPGPLAGVRVVDLTAMLAGPYVTMLLADLGADVVKIEPARGDVTRGAGPWRDGAEATTVGGYFQSVNRGKRGVVLDLKSEPDLKTFRGLVREADIVVENFSAGVMDRLGLSYESLAETNPRLIYGALRGFGDARTGASPYADWLGVDVIAQAMGGFLSITGTADGEPIKSGPGIGDIIPGMHLTIGLLAALHHARVTGRGQFVDVAMYDSILAISERIIYQHSISGVVPKPSGNAHPLWVPFNIMRTADGWVAISGASENHWQILAKELGRPDWTNNELYGSNPLRAAWREEIESVLNAWISVRTTAEVLKTFGGKIPIGPVNNVADIYADPHVEARSMLVDVPQADGTDPITIAGSPIKLSRTPAGVRGAAPLLGQFEAGDILSDWLRAPQDAHKPSR